MQIGLRQFVACTKLINNHYSDIIVSAFDKNGRRLLNNLKITLVTGYLASILLIILLGLYFSRETFAPIAKIINASEKISGSGLHMRVPTPKGKGELVKLANTINASLARIETAFNMQKQFVSHASHELRTPVTALAGELELALMKERTATEYQTVIASTLEDSRRLSQLIDQLLLFAQTSGTEELHSKTRFRLDELVLDLITKPGLNPENREIKFELESSDPDEEMLMVEGNEQLLSVAIGNILDNAIKYSHEDHPVRVSLKPFDTQINVTIVDQGSGIPSSEMNLIFEPFYRSDTVSSKPGFGIGLSLARRIIELHYGELNILSEPGKGTTVIISIPLVNPSGL